MAMSRTGTLKPRGPIPNRTEDLSRERDAARGNKPPVTKGTLKELTVPEADPDWHPIAKMMWEAAASSGMFEYYQNTDLAFLYSLLDDLTNLKRYADDHNGKIAGQTLAVIYAALSSLGFTEGDRRRMRIELEAPNTEEDTTAADAIASYEEGLRAVK